MAAAPLKTVIITPEIVGPMRNGGIGTFVTHFARLLGESGRAVTIVYTGEVTAPRSEWEGMYRNWGVTVIESSRARDSVPNIGNLWFIQFSRHAADAVPADADIVYTQDWLANGFHLTRWRRYQPRPYPALVNVLHSNSAWVRDAMRKFPESLDDELALDFAERYTACHSDFIASPTQHMLNWTEDAGWRLPERQRVLGYPFFPDETLAAASLQPAQTFKRLVFFGRIETRKGIELFVDTLLHLQTTSSALNELDEIVLLGKGGDSRFGTPDSAADCLRAALHQRVLLLDTLDTFQAQHYLAAHAADSLVVMPSLNDNLPYSIIEASLIPGLTLICSNSGGIPEIFGNQGQGRLFTPYVQPFARKLAEWLQRGPRSSHELVRYDWQQRNQDWLDFHAEVEAYAREVKDAPVISIPPGPAQGEKTVDVCIPYYNHGKYLPQLLQALEWQTTSNFHVIVVNDASTDPGSVRVFEDMARRYHQRGWTFVANADNQGLSATRNRAVSLGKAEYVIFIDADNVPLPHMIERFLTCIRASGDDCLTCYMMAFEGDAPPFSVRFEAGKPLIADSAPWTWHYTPIGSSLELGLFSNPFGDANFIIRRSVFEQVSGFSLAQPHYRYITGEDQELLTRLAFGGWRQDVIPEHLFYYRHVPNSLMRTTSHYENTMRTLILYRDHLREPGLEHLIPFLYGLYQRSCLPGSQRNTNPDWVSTHVPWRVMAGALWLKIRKNIRRIAVIGKNL